MFQSTVAIQPGFGVPGELNTNSPWRARSYILRSDSAAYNVVGATALTQVSQGVAKAGGTGMFVGILAAPKTYPNYGTAVGGPLAPTMTVPNEIDAQAVSMGQLNVTLPGPASIGDKVAYNTTTGALTTFPALTSFTGVIANSTGVLTVSSLAAGGYVDTDSLLSGANVPAGTRITSQLTGTAGGAGTYQTNITTAVASTTMTIANSVGSLGAGYAQVPNAEVFAYDVTAAGIAVIQLTD